MKNRKQMNIVIVGHVDHGKSTIIGRLLADTNSLPKGKLDQVKEKCYKNSKPFEYAFLLDALKDEQEQGITIDSARCFFKTEKRDYLIIDAPGHIEFLKNMISGASHADAALLVIAADEGVQENSKRHAYMLSMLGIKQVAVLINKMDIVDYSEKIYEKIKTEFQIFLEKINIKVNNFIPVSGREGINLNKNSNKTKWYKGESLLEISDKFENSDFDEKLPFRMPVQAIYRFTANNDNRRIIAGTIETGNIKKNDKIVFYPSGKTSSVSSIEKFNSDVHINNSAGYAVGFTLKEQIFIKRGEIAVKLEENKPEVSSLFKANIFWLGKKNLKLNKEYFLKICTNKVKIIVKKISKIIDASSLNLIDRDYIKKNEIAECLIKTDKPISFDTIDKVVATSRFVIIDDTEISGGGIITDSVKDEYKDLRDKIIFRNLKWEKSSISKYLRTEKLKQKPAMLIITGLKNSGKKTLARKIESCLFEKNKNVYFLGIGNILYGVDSDIKFKQGDYRKEHLRRLSEVANILIDAGNILIVTAVELNNEELDLIKTSIGIDFINSIWIGEEVTTDIKYDLKLESKNTEINSEKIINYIKNEGIIF